MRGGTALLRETRWSTLTGTGFHEGKGTLELIMIYEVQRGRIARTWSIAGAKTLGPNP